MIKVDIETVNFNNLESNIIKNSSTNSLIKDKYILN
jgi:hypothetical protein